MKFILGIVATLLTASIIAVANTVMDVSALKVKQESTKEMFAEIKADIRDVKNDVKTLMRKRYQYRPNTGTVGVI